jgi:hypothetical protein
MPVSAFIPNHEPQLHLSTVWDNVEFPGHTMVNRIFLYLLFKMKEFHKYTLLTDYIKLIKMFFTSLILLCLWLEHGVYLLQESLKYILHHFHVLYQF